MSFSVAIADVDEVYENFFYSIEEVTDRFSALIPPAKIRKIRQGTKQLVAVTEQRIKKGKTNGQEYKELCKKFPKSSLEGPEEFGFASNGRICRKKEKFEEGRGVASEKNAASRIKRRERKTSNG